MTDNQSTTIRGQWWLPTSPGDKLLGTLSLLPGKRAALETEGRFWQYPWANQKPGVSVAVRFDDLFESAPIVLGVSSQGEAITLLECHESRAGSDTSSLDAKFALVGAGFECVEDVVLQCIEAHLTHLDSWSSDSGFAIEFLTTGETRMAYKKPTGVSATVSSGLTIGIGFDVTGPIFKHPNNEFRMTQRAVAFIEASEGLGLHELLVRMDRFRKFIALGVGAPVGITMIRARSPKVNPHKTFFVHASHLVAEDSDESPRRNEMLFSLPDVRHQLGTLLDRWGAREDLLGPVYNLYDGTINSRAMYVEHQFTSFFQAIESYHRRTVAQAGKDRIPAKQRMATVIRDCDAQWLFKQPTDDAIDDLVSVRDYFTHYLPERDQRVPDMVTLYNDTTRLRLLLEMVLLKELGFNNQEITKMFKVTRRLERLSVTKT
ncbi:MAG: HEPN domain-containing protein [Bryobacteraceae bacterium]|jgi:hypothetical protein